MLSKQEVLKENKSKMTIIQFILYPKIEICTYANSDTIAVIRPPFDRKSHDTERKTWGRIFHIQISLFNPEIRILELEWKKFGNEGLKNSANLIA